MKCYLGQIALYFIDFCLELLFVIAEKFCHFFVDCELNKILIIYYKKIIWELR